jgi:hypothetical protein
LAGSVTRRSAIQYTFAAGPDSNPNANFAAGPDSNPNANFAGEREDLNPKVLIRIFPMIRQILWSLIYYVYSNQFLGLKK